MKASFGIVPDEVPKPENPHGLPLPRMLDSSNPDIFTPRSCTVAPLPLTSRLPLTAIENALVPELELELELPELEPEPLELELVLPDFEPELLELEPVAPELELVLLELELVLLDFEPELLELELELVDAPELELAAVVPARVTVADVGEPRVAAPATETRLTPKSLLVPLALTGTTIVLAELSPSAQVNMPLVDA